MRILFLSNSYGSLADFRTEFIEDLCLRGHQVYLGFPLEDSFRNHDTSFLRSIGCKYIRTDMEGHGQNPVDDIRLFHRYVKIMKSINPDVVLTYTIKPNIYGAFAAKVVKKRIYMNITGLGIPFVKEGLSQKIVSRMYRIASRSIDGAFFQNYENVKIFKKNGIIIKNTILVPGSGVNLEKHRFESYPVEDGITKLLFIGKLRKDKGIGEYLKAIEIIRNNYGDRVRFSIITNEENSDYMNIIHNLENKGYLRYLGYQNDVHKYIKENNAIILPSYHEGLSNSLLEAAACGRAIIASSIPGCKETFIEGISGIGCKPKNIKSLTNAIERFLRLSYEEKKHMGEKGRLYIEENFDRRKVISIYKKEIMKSMEF